MKIDRVSTATASSLRMLFVFRSHFTHITAMVVLFAVTATSTVAEERDPILSRVSEAYRGMANRFMVRATIETRIQRGGRFKAGPPREYRLIEAGGVTRSDTLLKGSPSFVVIHRDDKLMLYITLKRAAAELPESDADAEPMRAAIAKLHVTFFQRFADLAYGKVAVTSHSVETVKVGRQTKPCHYLKIRPDTDQPQRWTGELWIDTETSLVWRAKLQSHGEDGSVLDEDVRVLEIASGDSVPSLELDWRPPTGTEKLLRIPSVLP